MQGRPSFGKAWHYNKGLRESGWLYSPATEDTSGGERIATAWMALSLLLPRHSLFRQRQAFQPASFISICELSLRPKQRNALLAKISGKKPLIYLNLAIFQADRRPYPALSCHAGRKIARWKTRPMTKTRKEREEKQEDACNEAEEQVDGAARPGWNDPDWCGWGDSNSQAEALASKTSVSTNSTTSAFLLLCTACHRRLT